VCLFVKDVMDLGLVWLQSVAAVYCEQGELKGVLNSQLNWEV